MKCVGSGSITNQIERERKLLSSYMAKSSLHRFLHPSNTSCLVSIRNKPKDKENHKPFLSLVKRVVMIMVVSLDIRVCTNTPVTLDTATSL